LVQFPWRLIGPATLLLAWLAAAGLPSGKYHRAVGMTAVCLFFFYSITWTYRQQPDRALAVSGLPTDVIQYEVDNPGAAGTTYQGEFLPIWAAQLPSPDELRSRYEVDLTPSRLAEVPAGTRIVEESTGLVASSYTVEAGTPTQIVYNLFYFLVGRRGSTGRHGPCGRPRPRA
jgi:hypothetical protein